MAWKQVYLRRNSDGAQTGPHPIEHLSEWNHRGEIPPDTMVVDVETGEARWPNELAQIPQAPAMPAARAHSAKKGSKWIPQNAPAVLGYYLSVFAVLGVFVCFVPGFVLGVAAMIVGMLGLKQYRKDPEKGGKMHAWTAIILGGLCALAGIVGSVLFGWALAQQ